MPHGRFCPLARWHGRAVLKARIAPEPLSCAQRSCRADQAFPKPRNRLLDSVPRGPTQRRNIRPAAVEIVKKGRPVERQSVCFRYAALAKALRVPPAAFFQFDREERDERTLHKKIDSLLDSCTTHELNQIYRVAKALKGP